MIAQFLGIWMDFIKINRANTYFIQLQFMKIKFFKFFLLHKQNEDKKNKATTYYLPVVEPQWFNTSFYVPIWFL